MATSKAAKVQPQQYAAGTGYDVGDIAPTTLYCGIGTDGAPVGPVSETQPGGHGMVVCAAGQPVGSDARRLLDTLGTDTGAEG